jgi:PAS domain-containing protein
MLAYAHMDECIRRVGGWKANIETDRFTWTDGVRGILEISDEVPPSVQEALSYFQPEYVPQIQTALRSALRDGRPFMVEAEAVTAAGRRIWTEVRGLCRSKKRTGRSWWGTFLDITERRSLSLASERLAAQYKAILDTTQDGFAVLDEADGSSRSTRNTAG